MNEEYHAPIDHNATVTSPQSEASYTSPAEIKLQRSADERLRRKKRLKGIGILIIASLIAVGIGYIAIMTQLAPQPMNKAKKENPVALSQQNQDQKNWANYVTNTDPVAIIVGEGVNEYAVTPFICHGNQMRTFSPNVEIEFLDPITATEKFGCLMAGLSSGKNGLQSGQIAYAVVGKGVRSANVMNNQILTDFHIYQPTIYSRHIEIKNGHIVDKETKTIFYAPQNTMQWDEISPEEHYDEFDYPMMD